MEFSSVMNPETTSFEKELRKWNVFNLEIEK